MTNEENLKNKHSYIKNISFKELSIVKNIIFWVDSIYEGETKKNSIFARPFNNKRAIPQKLIEQLKYGGIMVLPVGFSKEEQTLIKVRKDLDQTHYDEIFKVRFVPLVEGSQNIRNYQDG